MSKEDAKSFVEDTKQRAVQEEHNNAIRDMAFPDSVVPMMKIRDSLKIELGLTPRGPKRIYAGHSKGLSE